MIITEKVNVKINGANKKYLEQFYKNVIINETLEVDVNHLSKGSNSLILVKCDICSKEVTIMYKQYNYSIAKGGYYSCSQKCGIKKGEATNLIKYGTKNVFQNEEIKNKIKEGFISKYGVENPSFVPEIVQKIKDSNNKTYADNLGEIRNKCFVTNIERYGVAEPNQTDEFKEKIKQINLNLYGVENGSQYPETLERIRQTNLKKFGVEYPLQSLDIQKKIKKTILEKYGVACISQNKDIQEKIKQTVFNKYGVYYVSQVPEIREKQINGGYKIKKHDIGLNYQGTYEKSFLDYCLLNNIVVTKPSHINYILENNDKRYFPDFYIEKLNLIIEIKSTYYNNLHLQRNDAKKEATIANGFKYLMIMDKNYQELENLLKI